MRRSRSPRPAFPVPASPRRTIEGARAARTGGPGHSPGRPRIARPGTADASPHRRRRADGPPARRAGGNSGRPQPEWSCGGPAALELGQGHVETDLLAQPAGKRLGRGKGAVLEELVGRGAAAAKREVGTGLPTALDSQADLALQRSEPFPGKDRWQRIARHVTQGEGAVPRTRNPQQLGRIGAKIAFAIDVDDGPRLVFLSPRPG